LELRCNVCEFWCVEWPFALETKPNETAKEAKAKESATEKPKRCDPDLASVG